WLHAACHRGADRRRIHLARAAGAGPRSALRACRQSSFAVSQAGLVDGFDDRDVAGAAADVPRENLADALAAGLGLLAEEHMRGGEHPRRAKAALKRVVLAKCPLQSRQFALAG